MVLRTMVVALAVLLSVSFLPHLAGAQDSSAPVLGQPFTPPASPRITYNFNPAWKFIRQDVSGAQAVGFDDAKWETVSTPHTFNDVDSFRSKISHSGGDRGTYKGVVWYRKHFKLPAGSEGKKIFLEFEGLRQAGQFFLNGKEIGLYENGVTAYGLDLTPGVTFGDSENVLVVRVDNNAAYLEQATKTAYQWNSNAFNPNFGGIVRRVWLHVTGKIYQTLPLYCGLQTSGVYVHASNFSIANRTADVTVESQVCNSSGERATVALSAVVVDKQGRVRAKFDAEPLDMVDGEKSVIEATGALADAHFWSPDDPYLYDVYSILSVDGKVVDVNKVVTGFRKTAFKGGAGTGGVFINDQFVYLKGFAHRVSDAWAGLGQAYPDWMHDLNAQLVRDCHANYMRWMHVAPQKVDSDAYDKYGIVQVCPAGDKERLVQGRQWEQRAEVMRDTIIYFRNSPSILFWEAGNTIVSPEQMQQMVDLRKELDPDGGRVMGTRGDGNNQANTALTPIAEYYGVMIGQAPQTDRLEDPTDMFRAYSAERRDRAPLIETEDFREEAARRFWDDYSPPYYGFKQGPEDTWKLNSESFALAGVRRYWQYWSNRISNTDAAHAKWSGYASIYLFDSNADGRQQSSEVCRVSGKLDAVRLPKELYFATRVMQSDTPDIHIIGHWNYPAETTKYVYVVSNAKSVELMLNGKSLGKNSAPRDGFIFEFPDVKWEAGSLKAIGETEGKVVAQHELTTAGEPAAIKLTPMVGPRGLLADGEDVALIDVEVVDAKGQRCPTDDERIDFTVEGPGIWRGGYNSGKTNSTNNLYLNTECGINRVSVRSTLSAGEITITAKRKGLKDGTVTVQAKAFEVKDGLAKELSQKLAGPRGAKF